MSTLILLDLIDEAHLSSSLEIQKKEREKHSSVLGNTRPLTSNLDTLVAS